MERKVKLKFEQYQQLVAINDQCEQLVEKANAQIKPLQDEANAQLRLKAEQQKEEMRLLKRKLEKPLEELQAQFTPGIQAAGQAVADEIRKYIPEYDLESMSMDYDPQTLELIVKSNNDDDEPCDCFLCRLKQAAERN